MQPNALAGKVALITGGARRVGRGIALGFAEAGAHVVIHHGHSDDDAERTATEAEALGVQALVVKADLTQPDDIARMFREVSDRFVRLDVLVNSASNFDSTPLLDLDVAAWQEVLGTNVSAPFYTTQHAARLMQAGGEGGCIINIADNSGLRPWSKRPAHSVSKAALIMLTQVSARALAADNICVNCLVLGPILPSPDMDEAAWERIEGRLPLKRSGTVEEVASAAVFVATNNFMTGAVVHVDGGEWLGGD